MLDVVVEQFNEDIKYALNHKKFLIDNLEIIFAYYYFFYISQLILKINRDYDENVGEIEELFFLLDWESVSRNRKTVNSGYSFLKDRAKNSSAKVACLDQVNVLFGSEEFLLLGDVYDEYCSLDDQQKKEFIRYLKKWVEDYEFVKGYDNYLPNDFKELVDILFKDLNGEFGILPGIKDSRYPLNLEELCKRFFVKRRGRYGYVLNINREILLTITALCVKDEKIMLNQLFKEYERRGLYFDSYSKIEIESFLTKLNLIDKKSDSGDAKYVKPVL